MNSARVFQLLVRRFAIVFQIGATATLFAAAPVKHPVVPTPAAPSMIEPDGTLDLQFNAGKFTDGQVLATVRQPDGKILIGGVFSKVHGITRLGVARLNADGTLDSSFTPPADTVLNAASIVLQADGKIILTGGSGSTVSLARLNIDGSLDSNLSRKFSINGADDGNGNATSPGIVKSALIQPDGKLVVVGRFFYIITGPGTSVGRSCVARFNVDGSLDTSFYTSAGVSSGFDTSATSVDFVVRQNIGNNAGKIVIEGSFDYFDFHGPNPHSNLPGLIRLNPDGSFDTTFSSYGTAEGRLSAEVRGMFVQTDDKIVVFGTKFSDFGVLARSETNGARDNGFVPGVFDNYDGFPQVLAVAQQSNGNLIVGGSFHSLGGNQVNNVVRLTTNGSSDNTFATAAAGPNSTAVSAVLVLPGDKVVIGGYFSSYNGALRQNLAWINANGTVDSILTGLSGVTDANPTSYSLAVQPDGKILVGGLFNNLNGVPHYNLVRLNSDSSIDSSFSVVGTHGSVRAILIQPDGKIVIAGNLTAVNGVPKGRIARLNADGTLDPSFDAGSGADSFIYAVAQDGSGNIYAGGAFSTFNGAFQSGIAKLTPSGALDPAFNPGGGGTNNTVFGLTAPDSSGQLVIAGQFSRYNGVTTRTVTRISAATGARDSTFVVPTVSYGIVFSIVPTPDGKYYIGGSGLNRLNSNGSRDTSFAPPSFATTHYSLALQNGKLYVGGVGTPGNPALTRLTDTGAFDQSFNIGSGIESEPFVYVNTYPEVRALALQPDGKLLAGGLFTKYNGTPRVDLIRVTGFDSSNPAPSVLGNISTRLRVETGDNALIGGFIVAGSQPKRVLVRALGPSLGAFGIAEPLANPVLELRGPSGPIASNDDWVTSPDKQAIIDTTAAPSNDLESAIIATLPGDNTGYTALVRGANGGTGIGVVEVFDLDSGGVSMANISTRGFVQTGQNVLIAGTIVVGPNPRKVIVRAIGPSLPISGALADPTLELRDSNGGLVAANDNWEESPNKQAIIDSSIPPSDPKEAAIVQSLPGNNASYTAIVRGVNDTTGIAVVEIYALN